MIEIQEKKEQDSLELTEEEIKHLLKSSESAGIDVTGGIGNKLKKALEIAHYTDVYFANGIIKGNLIRILKGENPGTIIKRW